MYFIFIKQSNLYILVHKSYFTFAKQKDILRNNMYKPSVTKSSLKWISSVFFAFGLFGSSAFATMEQDKDIKGGSVTNDLIPIQTLQSSLDKENTCGTYDAAIKGTSNRIEQSPLHISDVGKTIVINIAGQNLYAYEDGNLALESKVVVGGPSWATPQLDTEISYVRLNPTWTVPQSIIEYKGWRDKVRSDPSYFTDQGFLVVAENGSTMTPKEAASSGASIRTFVQQPSNRNALGLVKFGLRNAGAIYLHDTNAKHVFDDANRARSHGCVRVEKSMELAAWILDMKQEEVETLVDENDRKNRTDLNSAVRVILGYWTAWKTTDDKLTFYRDVYHLDPHGNKCYVNKQAENLNPPRKPIVVNGHILSQEEYNTYQKN